MGTFDDFFVHLRLIFLGMLRLRYTIMYLLASQSGFSGRVINVDKLTYAGNLANLAAVDAKHGTKGDRRYAFERADIVDRPAMERVMAAYEVDAIVHFAAESHVDRSIIY